MQPAPTDGAPLWQAWVAAGKTREERLRRFAEVPEQHRARVASHVRTVQAIAEFYQRRRK